MADKKKEEPTEDRTPIQNLTLQEKIARITGEIEAVEKKKRPGDTVSFKYRSIDEVANAINPFIASYGLTIQSKVFRCDVTPIEFQKEVSNKMVTKRAYFAVVGIRYIIADGSGQFEEWEEVNMSEDYADKAVTQASSMCYKYFLIRKFIIPTEDTPDGDSRNPDRDVSHDNDYSGPRPTEWLDEGTDAWHNLEREIKENGRQPADVIKEVEQKFKINKKQRALIGSMVPGKKQGGNAPAEQKQEVKTDTPAVATGGARKKSRFTAEHKTKWQELIDKNTPFTKGVVEDELRLYNNNVEALKTKRIKDLVTITSLYDLDDVVLEHYKMLL